MGTEKTVAVVEKEQGSLYCLYTDGTIKKHVDKVSISNGLAWSADNKTMYYIDSIPRCVYAFDYDIENGSLSKYTQGRIQGGGRGGAPGARPPLKLEKI